MLLCLTLKEHIRWTAIELMGSFKLILIWISILADLTGYSFLFFYYLRCTGARESKAGKTLPCICTTVFYHVTSYGVLSPTSSKQWELGWYKPQNQIKKIKS